MRFLLVLVWSAFAIGTLVGCGGDRSRGLAFDAAGIDAARADGGGARDSGGVPPTDSGLVVDIDAGVSVPDAAMAECTTDAECSDGVDCTYDACRSGRCRHSRTATGCAAGLTCDLTLGCVLGIACGTDADCADTDACTTSERCQPSTRTCSSRILDGDGDGDPPPVCGGFDCDDAAYSRSSIAPEQCDRYDNDCDGEVDEGPPACSDPALVCVDGACVCPAAGQAYCSGSGGTRACVDVLSDPARCGECYHSCDPGVPCVGGSCACGAGRTDCMFGCTDTATDPNNCGRCGHFCASGAFCEAGTCCGASGETCCSAGPSCSTTTYCNPATGTCSSACGRVAQPCCTGSRCTAAGSTCGPAGTCVACGARDQPCCASSACSTTTLACDAGTCRHCGATGEPCCTSGLACIDASADCNATSHCELPACAMPLAHLPATLLPRCAASTYTCANACGTFACVYACTDPDTTPPASGIDCSGCIDYAVSYCHSMRCPSQYGSLNCCYQAHCATSTDPTTCIATWCSLHNDLLNRCLAATPSTCTYIATGEPRGCFP